MKNEPTMDQIEDYNGKESRKKRNTVRMVILFCIIIGIGFAISKYNNTKNSDYVGTKENPGINIPNN